MHTCERVGQRDIKRTLASRLDGTKPDHAFGLSHSTCRTECPLKHVYQVGSVFVLPNYRLRGHPSRLQANLCQCLKRPAWPFPHLTVSASLLRKPVLDYSKGPGTQTFKTSVVPNMAGIEKSNTIARKPVANSCGDDHKGFHHSGCRWPLQFTWQ